MNARVTAEEIERNMRAWNEAYLFEIMARNHGDTLGVERAREKRRALEIELEVLNLRLAQAE